MKYGSLILAIGALWSSQISAGELQSVYVAPGGVYIASARVYVTPGNGAPPYAAPGPTYYEPGYVRPGPAYAPGYVPPRQVYRAPAFYGTNGSVYPAPPVYIDQEPAYPSAYALEYAPRPPAPVPYIGGERCVVNPGYGRSEYCD